VSAIDPALRARAAEVKGWVQELLGTPGPVLVTELRCTKAECPSVETVIAVVAQGAQRRWTIARPLSELGRAELAAALAGAPASGGRPA
jgi:hypothetical protein